MFTGKKSLYILIFIWNPWMYFGWNCRVYFNSKACGAYSILPSIKGVMLKCAELQACICKHGFTGRVKITWYQILLIVCTSQRKFAIRITAYYTAIFYPAIFQTEALTNKVTSRLIPWNTVLYHKPPSRSWNPLSLRNPNAPCSDNNSQSLDLIQSLMNPVLTIMSCFFKIQINSLPSSSGLPRGLSIQGFRQIFRSAMSLPPHLPCFHYHNNVASL